MDEMLIYFFVGAIVAGLVGLHSLHAERALHSLRQIDSVTGLAGREGFAKAIDRLLSAGKSCTILALDLSSLRMVTETHGWEAGDAVLREMARRLGLAAGRRGATARLAGTDFAIALPDVSDALDAATAARRLMADLEEPVVWKGQQLRLTMGAGLALAPKDGKNSQALLHALGTALAAAKKERPGSLCFYDARVEDELALRRATETMIRDALAKKLFKLAYQPVFELATGRLKGFEALLRLDYPGHGPVSPALLIPVAEETGLINAIGAWTVEEACRTALAWPEDYKVAVNLSPVQFRSGSLIRGVRETLEKLQFPAYRLELEVTEGLLLEDTEYVKAQLTALEETGVRIVLDDFGTGYSSLSYLWQFPFRKLKIDQSFLRNMDANPQVIGILRAIVALARSLGLPVTVEGVETQAQADLMRGLGCNEAQGYHLGRPMPQADAAALVLRDLAARASALDGQRSDRFAAAS
jgi:diguanylate cyclase (GGDEF)-like protein